MDKFDDIKWEDLNWYGQFLVNWHNAVFGPDAGINPWAQLAIINWGLKSAWLK